jgi:hypothetical protein
VEEAAAALGREAEPVVVAVDRGRKAERISSYASQIAALSPEHGRLDQAEALPGEERYWLLPPSSSSE